MVRAKLAGIKQGVRKMNLVATLVRGMTVDDALNQLAVTPKRAAKTVSKVVHAARSNAVQNHGLDGTKLLVAEAFVGKDLFLKRVNPHGRGKSGVKVRQRSQLTVLVREMKDEEASRRQQSKTRGSTWRRKLSKLQLYRLAPHQLIRLENTTQVASEAQSPQESAGP